MSHALDRVTEVMARLRAPDGCPWDRKQTHATLKPYLLEETYEVLEAIDREDPSALREELGDLMLQIAFHAQIGTEAGTFTIDDILTHLADKLVRRHPHVFDKKDGKGEPGTADEVVTRWEDIKRNERRQTGDAGRADSALGGVPKTLPSLLRAYQVQARASRVGFDWPHTRQGQGMVIDKIEEEIGELKEALVSAAPGAASSAAPDTRPEVRRQIESEFGDLLFALVNLGRFIKVNPEDALRLAVDRFTDRFSFMEQRAARLGKTLDQMTLAEMDDLWEEAKQAADTP